MQAFTSTSLVGGQSGALLGDIYFMNSTGNFILNDTAKNTLDLGHPIQQIAVSCGWIVDGVSVTYQIADGSASTLSHGSVFTPPSNVITFGVNEVLAGVFGRAGYQTYYARDLVNNVGFVVFDTVAETSRIAGPFGNNDGSNQGTPFYSSDVLAFGSFAEEGDALGLSGLFFYKTPNN